MSGPADQAARRAITSDLDHTLFVEAGAGTGKTRALVGRVLELVVTGRARLEQIAAITFTEAAAAELRDRIAERLERVAAGGDEEEEALAHRDPDRALRRAELARQAVGEIDATAIGTLHSFARRMLSEYPFEAGLPPSFEVFDQLRSSVAFDERWERFVDRLLGDERYESAVLRAHVLQAGFDQLKVVAAAFNENWDLVSDLVLSPGPLGPVDASAVLGALDEASDLLSHCLDPTDRLAGHLEGAVAQTRARLVDSRSDLEVLEVLVHSPKLGSGRRGRQLNWDGHLEAAREALECAESARLAVLAEVGAGVLSQLLSALAEQTMVAAAERRREGRLEFHDLLVGARDLLRSRPEVRSALGAKYRFLLIDEFQDTDPIQVELAVRLVSEDPGAMEKDWRDLDLEGGRLFFVGDPKQAIYRFRRADIALFMEVRRLCGDRPLQLTANHRSVPGILDWVNALFGSAMGEGIAGQQPAYEALSAVRRPRSSAPAVTVVGGPSDDDVVLDELRRQEAAELARAIAQVRDQQWPLGAAGRPARLADVAVLVPTRTGLSILERALEDAELAYRLESSSLVYASAEVRDLLATLRAIDDPGDEVSILAALRSPLFGCGDDDLLAHRNRGGRFDYRAQPGHDDTGADPVTVGLRSLAQLHEQRWWLEVSGLIDKVIEQRRLFELSLDQRRHRDAWRRLRFVADQARQFVDAFGGDLRRYLAWAELQSDEEARVTETVLPETDDDSVRIMTIHAAKGLEFPVVVLAGLSTLQRERGGARALWGDATVEVAVNQWVRTPGFGVAAGVEAEMEAHERVRLLYVAATRAQDHLIVGLLHKAGSPCPAALIESHGVTRAPLAVPLGSHQPPLDLAVRHRPLSRVAVAPADRAAWRQRRHDRLEAAGFPKVVAATGVRKLALEAQGTNDPDDPSDAEVLAGADADAVGAARGPWRRGRAGTAVGRAVHAVLQSVDLARPAGLRQRCASAAAAEGVSARAAEIEALVISALHSETVSAAARLSHWRELYVGVPIGERVLEGFVDLLVETPSGLVVVDYKTDRVDSPHALAEAVARYRLQGAAYAVGVEAALGKPVVGCTLLFVAPDRALPRPILDLAEAKAEVTALLSG